MRWKSFCRFFEWSFSVKTALVSVTFGTILSMVGLTSRDMARICFFGDFLRIKYHCKSP